MTLIQDRPHPSVQRCNNQQRSNDDGVNEKSNLLPKPESIAAAVKPRGFGSCNENFQHADYCNIAYGGCNGANMVEIFFKIATVLLLIYLVFIGHEILERSDMGRKQATQSPSKISGGARHMSFRGLVDPSISNLNKQLLIASDTMDMPTPSFEQSSTSPLSPSQPIKILIVHIGDDEGQSEMASAVARGAYGTKGDAVIISIRTVSNATFDEVLQADAIVLGSSVENGNTHPALQAWINNEWNISRAPDLSRKVGAAFVTAGGISAGQESTLQSLLRAMLIFQLIIVGGDSWRGAMGAAAITAEAPFTSAPNGGTKAEDKQYFPRECYATSKITEQDQANQIHPLFLDKAYELGGRVATITSLFKSHE